MRPSSRGLSLVAVALLAASIALPLALADHAYSHRYVIWGRVVDGQGLPIAGTRVDVGFDNKLTIEDFCGSQPGTDTAAFGITTTRSTTNAEGEFTYCFHVHGIPRGTDAFVHAKAAGVEVTSPVDYKMRKTFINVVVPNGTGKDTSSFNSTYLVSGRLWTSEPGKIVESITVYGDTVKLEPVTITYTTAPGEKVTTLAKTNHYGDFATRVNVTRDQGPGKITVSGAGSTVEVPADMSTRWSDVKMEITAPSATGTVLKVAGGVVLVAAVGGAGFVAFRKVSEKRSLDLARAKSGRKRAQR